MGGGRWFHERGRFSKAARKLRDSAGQYNTRVAILPGSGSSGRNGSIMAPMSALTELRGRVEAFLAANRDAEVTEDGELLFDLRETDYSVDVSKGRVLLHLWSPQRNWVRRVTAAEETNGRIVLAVERFGASRPGRLVIAQPGADFGGSRERRATRRGYARALRRLLERQFPGAEIEGLTSRADAKRSLSGLYTRARLREGRRWWAVIGVGGEESAETADGVLTAGLIWLHSVQERFPERVWAGLRIVAPPGRAAGVGQSLTFLDRDNFAVELFAVEVDSGGRELHLVTGEDSGNVRTRVVPLDRSVWRLKSGGRFGEQILALDRQAIDAWPRAGGDEVSFRFRGLEFAWHGKDEFYFGLGGDLDIEQEEAERVLTSDNFGELEALVGDLQRRRTAGGNAADIYYRWRAEAWLEHLTSRQPDRIDPRLRPDCLYRQVLTAGGAARGFADLLGVTREGRLAVIELKAAADINLPMQGLDYWMRVAWHHDRGELAGAGYFAGIELSDESPELILVSPALQFHPAVQTMTARFSPRVPVTLVGLSESWREELKVVWRRPGRE